MKLQDLFEDQNPGTYAAIRFSRKTTSQLAKYIKDNDIPNAVNTSKMHCTLLYSRKPCPDYVAQGNLSPAWIGTPVGLDVWESKGDPEKVARCLVLEFECKELDDRHAELMKEHKATHDFPDYKTHVTLSYDIGDMDESKLPDITKAVDELKIISEYGADLDLNWSKKVTK